MVIKKETMLDQYRRKFKKLKNDPGIFFRDYFNKRYPITNTEMGVSESTETAFLESLFSPTSSDSPLAFSSAISEAMPWFFE